MTIKIRIDGEPDEITTAVSLLRELFELAYNGKTTPNEASFTVRAYMEARPHSTEDGPTTRPAMEPPEAWLAREQAERAERANDFARRRAAMVNQMDADRRRKQQVGIPTGHDPSTAIEPVDLDG